MYVSLKSFRICRRIAERAPYPVACLIAKVAKPGNAHVCLFGMLQTMQAISGKSSVACHMAKSKIY